MCDSKLSTIPKECSFKILLAASEESYVQLTQKSNSKDHYVIICISKKST